MDVLTTTAINSLISTYQDNEVSKRVAPLTASKTKYSTISSAYDTLLTKLTSFKTDLTTLTQTGADSIFNYRQASSSNTNFISSSAATTALPGSYDVRVSQLAKKDIAVSASFTSNSSNSITGNHTFKIVTGDGLGGEFTSSIDVAFTAGETNKTALEKIQNAINADKAVVLSDSKTGSDAYSGGAASFILNINGTETTISVDGSASTYSELMDSLVSSINNNTDGVTAQKVVDPLDPQKYKLSLTVDDSSKYISISQNSGFNLVGDLNISANQEKGASGIVSASTFSSNLGNSQLSVSSKNSGLGFRIMEMSDVNATSALSTFGLNFGAARPSFSQSGNTPGFTYSDVTSDNNLLNSKFTFNSLEMQRDSNTVTDVAQGLTMNLKSVMSAGDNTVSVAVSSDVPTIRSKVEGFISKFNDIYTYLKTNSAYNNSGTRGSLYGDSSAQSILSQFSSLVYSSVQGTDIRSLNDIGISFNSSSGLVLSDPAKLEDKINKAPDQIGNLFSSDSGIAKKLLTFVTPYVGSQGFLTKQKTSLNNNVKSMDDKIKSTESKIEKSAALLRNRYEQLQAQLADLISTQSYFGNVGSGSLT